MGPRERHSRHRSKTHMLPIVIGSFFGFFLLFCVAFGIGMIGNVNRWLSDLPDYTDADNYMVSEPTSILDANGNEIASLYVQNRESVTYDQISPYVLQGTVSTEDERFYQHNGVDILGIMRAVVVQLTGGSEGASTITQQLVRNTILSEEQFDNTIERKVREAWIAIQMEKIFSKEEILTMYLNTIYYGHGAYGIQAAAQTYFSKNASDLTLAEAALLVGLPNAPSQYDPTVNPDLAVQRRNIVLSRMVRNGVISQEEADAASAEELVLNVTEQPMNGTYAYPYFVDYVKNLLSDEFSTDVLFAGGLTIQTTIDPTIQAAAEQAAYSQMDGLGVDGLDVGMTVIDPDTGYILAMVGGRDYYSTDEHINHATSRRSTGSSFKAVTLAAAIEDGMDPYNTYINCNSPVTITDDYTLQNYGGYSYGTLSLAEATARSSNTGYVQVALAIGNDKVIDMAERLGIDTDAAQMDQSAASLTLTGGAVGCSTLEMSEAFATFAAGGEHRDAVAITQITNRSGEVLYQHTDSPEQVISEEVAQEVNNVLETVLRSGGTGSSGYPYDINQPVAGKTGTGGSASDTTDLWFCGYTPQLSVSIWVGRSLTNEAIPYLHTQDTVLPIFQDFMNAVLADTPREEFPSTDKQVTYKPSSAWDFVGGNFGASDATEEETEGEETTEETDGTESADTGNGNTSGTTPTTPGGGNTGSGGNSGSGGNTGSGGNGGSGGNTGGGSGNEPTDPEPEPEPDPEPEPEPTPPTS